METKIKVGSSTLTWVERISDGIKFYWTDSFEYDFYEILKDNDDKFTEDGLIRSAFDKEDNVIVQTIRERELKTLEQILENNFKDYLVCNLDGVDETTINIQTIKDSNHILIKVILNKRVLNGEPIIYYNLLDKDHVNQESITNIVSHFTNYISELLFQHRCKTYDKVIV